MLKRKAFRWCIVLLIPIISWGCFRRLNFAEIIYRLGNGISQANFATSLFCYHFIFCKTVSITLKILLQSCNCRNAQKICFNLIYRSLHSKYILGLFLEAEVRWNFWSLLAMPDSTLIFRPNFCSLPIRCMIWCLVLWN